MAAPLPASFAAAYAFKQYEIQKEAAEKEKEQLAAKAKERAQEMEASRAKAAAEAARSRKIFVCGDSKGCASKLYETVKGQASKVGRAEALLAVGRFLPEAVEQKNYEDPYLNGTEFVPVETFFVDPDATLLRTAPGGKTLCKNLNFLGGYGVREICGLRVAFLSGIYDAVAYNTDDVDFVGSFFTRRAVRNLCKMVVDDPKKRGIDVLLTCGWPAGLEAEIEEPIEKPVKLPDGFSWESACALPLAELNLEVQPRYHLFGTADLFYQRPPFETPGGHFCRLIGLGTVGSKDKQRKWLHALSLSPMTHMKRDELLQEPPKFTPSPFKSLKRPLPDDTDLPPTKKSAQSVHDSSDDDAP